jgi:hypothetical protein
VCHRLFQRIDGTQRTESATETTQSGGTADGQDECTADNSAISRIGKSQKKEPEQEHAESVFDPRQIQQSANIVLVAHTWVTQWAVVQNDHCIFFVYSALLCVNWCSA